MLETLGYVGEIRFQVIGEYIIRNVIVYLSDFFKLLKNIIGVFVTVDIIRHLISVSYRFILWKNQI